jgi:hypothetical protein
MKIEPTSIRIGDLLIHNEKIIEVLGIAPHCGDYAITTRYSWVYLKNCSTVNSNKKIHKK